MRVSEVFATGGGCGCDRNAFYGYDAGYQYGGYYDKHGRYTYVYYNGYNYGGYTYYGRDRRLGKL
ncbi:MAG: hypothetical protein JO281_08525 [Pseudonocardiales bacterium]|nr:hypothetical protein [Pseudonocardiales bacterium]